MREASAIWLAVVMSASLGAQTAAPKTDGGKAVSITGCLAPVQRNGSLAARPNVATPSPADAPEEANNPQPTGRFVLQHAVEDQGAALADKPKPAPTSYHLRGQEAELSKHVGHRVRITGSLQPPPSQTMPSPVAASAEAVGAVQVSAITMISAECSGPRPEGAAQ